MDFDYSSFIKNAFAEDIGSGDHTTLACVNAGAKQKAELLVKDNGIIAGIDLAKKIFHHFDSGLSLKTFFNDGDQVKKGNIAFIVSGSAQSILSCERLVLNCMQHLSGIATQTFLYQQKIKHTKAKVLDTRKTIPGLRVLEKWAVAMGGGLNHRMGLYDMILIKDNHVDYAGGIKAAIEKANDYLLIKKLPLKIEIEVRNFSELDQVLQHGRVHRIMLDNFSPRDLEKAIQIIDQRYETEASGGITLETIAEYAETGVNFISVGALTHSVKCMDMSLKAIS